MKANQKPIKKLPSTAHHIPICFEEHFWAAKINSPIVGHAPKNNPALFSPGAYRPADNPGGLSQTTFAPRRLHLRLKR